MNHEKLLKDMALHLSIVNEEVGLLQKDVSRLKTNFKWTIRIMGYMATLLTIIASKILFF